MRLRASLNSSEVSDNGFDNVRDHIKSKISGGVTYGPGGWKSKGTLATSSPNHTFLQTTKIVIRRNDSQESPEYGMKDLNL